MASETFKLPEWDAGPLNQFLKKIFPSYITPYQRLDVQRLRTELDPPKSHEAVYKWLRSGRLTPENAQALMKLANRPDHTASRLVAGWTHPSELDDAQLTLRDFDEFVFPGT